ncbi:MAG: four helix bundle protein [Prevotella sp.]|nr:four helix bundle protein [Prevotellaceae bacterium]MDY5946608.1 four helix bundle protein [Prevotella sp.]
MSNTFKDLIVWQKAHALVLLVYKLSGKFPHIERFGLCSQFQRAAVSIPANIAEGYKKLSKADKLRFINISQGSLEECRYYVILSKDLAYISIDDYCQLNALVEDVSRLLNAYGRKIKESSFVDEVQQ